MDTVEPRLLLNSFSRKTKINVNKNNWTIILILFIFTLFEVRTQYVVFSERRTPNQKNHTHTVCIQSIQTYASFFLLSLYILDRLVSSVISYYYIILRLSSEFPFLLATLTISSRIETKSIYHPSITRRRFHSINHHVYWSYSYVRQRVASKLAKYTT